MDQDKKDCVFSLFLSFFLYLSYFLYLALSHSLSLFDLTCHWKFVNCNKVLKNLAIIDVHERINQNPTVPVLLFSVNNVTISTFYYVI